MTASLDITEAEQLRGALVLVAEHLEHEAERERRLELEACAEGRTGLRDSAYARACAYDRAHSYVLGVLDSCGIEI